MNRRKFFKTTTGVVTAAALPVVPSRTYRQTQKHSIEALLAVSPVHTCVTGIAKDVASLFPDKIELVELWMLSRLIHGNAYILKNGLHVLNPASVKVLVAPTGDVFYGSTYVSGNVAIPATAMIHDRMHTMSHPLVGTSPLDRLETLSSGGYRFRDFVPPEKIWSATLVKGDGVVVGSEYDRESAMSDLSRKAPSDWTTQDVWRAFRYPSWKLGGTKPVDSEKAREDYWLHCLQGHVEAIEVRLGQDAVL